MFVHCIGAKVLIFDVELLVKTDAKKNQILQDLFSGFS